MKASVIAFEISDLPPPETVLGLWQDVTVGTVAFRSQCRGSDGDWANCTR